VFFGSKAERAQYVIELLKQGKRIREIAEEVHMSFGYDWKKRSLNCTLFIYDLFHVEYHCCTKV
jgi:hypothetical protein